jgi:hypothetical protein
MVMEITIKINLENEQKKLLTLSAGGTHGGA